MVGLGATMLKISIHAPREGGDFTQEEYDYLKSRFQSTPPARGATSDPVLYGERTAISIHAPREGGDSIFAPQLGQYFDFNPRPPRGGRRWRPWTTTTPTGAFQSTPPARGATTCRAERQKAREHFNPRPPRGGRPLCGGTLTGIYTISIHAPREGGDSYGAGLIRSTPPISIHAPREGGDGEEAEA